MFYKFETLTLCTQYVHASIYFSRITFKNFASEELKNLLGDFTSYICNVKRLRQQMHEWHASS